MHFFYLWLWPWFIGYWDNYVNVLKRTIKSIHRIPWEAKKCQIYSFCSSCKNTSVLTAKHLENGLPLAVGPAEDWGALAGGYEGTCTALFIFTYFIFTYNQSTSDVASVSLAPFTHIKLQKYMPASHWSLLMCSYYHVFSFIISSPMSFNSWVFKLMEIFNMENFWEKKTTTME